MNFKNFMNEAIVQAKIAKKNGEIPVGVAIVRKNKVISVAHNLTSQNPLLHAELQALQIAQRKLGSIYLNDCDLYSTLEPCPMCMHAIFLTRLRRVFFGVRNERDFRYNFEFYDCIMEKECGELLRDFFDVKRKVDKKIMKKDEQLP